MVQESGDDWRILDRIWISNGTTSKLARVEIRLELQEVDHES